MSESKHTIYGVLTALDREDVTRVLWTRTGEWRAAAMARAVNFRMGRPAVPRVRRVAVACRALTFTGETMTKEEVIAAFGVDPDMVGKRPRGWWIVDRIEEEEEQVGAQIGDLCVKTRDGGYNPIDPDAFRVGHCLGSVEDSFDETYRYYFYRRLDRPAGKPGGTEGRSDE